jgi:hypothetical protein
MGAEYRYRQSKGALIVIDDGMMGKVAYGQDIMALFTPRPHNRTSFR